MRILMTTDTVGGIWTFTQELTTGLLTKGCDIALVSLGRWPTHDQQRWVTVMEYTWGARFRFQALTTSLEWMQENGDAFAGAAPQLLRLASEFGADVLHLNQFCFGALSTDLPKVVTAHSDVLSWAKYCCIEALEDSPWLRRYVAMVSHGLAKADAVVAPTRWMLDEVAEQFSLPPNQAVIPNGRSVAMATHRRRKLQAITAGRLWDCAKNVAMLSKVSSPVPLLLAGESNFPNGGAVQAPIGSSCVGVLPADELFALFRRSAFYICTSLYEPFGLAPLEAALCGCAILANDLPSLGEVWGDAALYFDDAASLSALLTCLAADRGMTAAAQARSLARAQLYTREKMAASYFETFMHAQAMAETNAVAHVS